MGSTIQDGTRANDVDLEQLVSGSLIGSNHNPYNSMDSAVAEDDDVYETLGRSRSCCTGCEPSIQSPQNDPNTRRNVYTRYIRPCGTFPRQRVLDNNNDIPKPAIPVNLKTLKINRSSSKYRGSIRKLIFCFMSGLVIGLIICSVFWLTFDRLRMTEIVCEVRLSDDNGGTDDKEIIEADGEDDIRAKTTSRSITTQTEQRSVSEGLLKFTTTSSPITTTTSKYLTHSTSTASLSFSKTSRATATPSIRNDPTHSTPIHVSSTLPAKSTRSQAKSPVPKDMTQSTPENSSSSSLPSVESTAPINSANSLPSSRSPSESPTALPTSLDQSEPTPANIVYSTVKSSSQSFVSTTSSVLSPAFRESTTLGLSTKRSSTFSKPENLRYISTSNFDQYTSESTAKISSEHMFVDVTEESDTTTSLSTLNHAKDLTTISALFSAITKELPTNHQPSKDYLVSASFTEEIRSTSPVSTETTSGNVTPGTVAKRSVQGGYVYVRWGKQSCSVGTEQLYTGYAAGGHWQHAGGATNTICLPETPSWGNYSDTEDADRNLIYGTEYGSSDASFASITGEGENVKYKDVPCTLCKATGRMSHVLVPGSNTCFPGWTQEYSGYMMGSGYMHSHATELICVDSSFSHIQNSDKAKGGNFLFFAEVRSGSLPSTSYPSGRELACVVCTM